jgi:hypothetical protein
MTSNSIIIAIICGLTAAMLFLSPMSLGGMGLMMSSFTALPLFVCVLGFGTIIGVISGVVAAAVVAIFMGPLGALTVLGATLAPALWIGHSAGLSRNESGAQEWFPLSQILFRLAAISALIVVVLGVVAGYSQQWAIDQSTAMISELVQMQGPADGGTTFLDAQAIEMRAKDIATLIPFMMPVSILLLMVINLRLAERIARRFSWIPRPREDLPSNVGLPTIACGVLLAAVGMSFMNNDLGLVARVVAGAFGGAFALVGLATIHFVSRGFAARPFLLPLVYVVLLFSRFIAPVFAVLGVAETLFHLRARFGGRAKST